MSANIEKKEAAPRVTRSMRRLNSETESVDLENRPETPTGRIRRKIEESDAAVSTPKRTTRASSATRSLIDEQITASPLRRTTRRMSSDRAVESPIRATRLTRRSNQNLNESEDDSVVFVSEQPGTPRTLKSARKPVVKLEEVLEEETDTKLNTSENADELELRNRSISKSPVVLPTRNSQSPVVVLNRISTSPNGKFQGAPEPMSLRDEMKAADEELNGKKHEIFDLNGTKAYDLNESKDSISEELTQHPKATLENGNDIVPHVEAATENNDLDEEIPGTPTQLEIGFNKESEDLPNDPEVLIGSDANQEMAEIDSQISSEFTSQIPSKQAPQIEGSQEKVSENLSQNADSQLTSQIPAVTASIASEDSMAPMEIDESVQEEIHDDVQISQAELTDSSLRVEIRLTERHEVIEYEVSDLMKDFDNSPSAEQIKSVNVRNVEMKIQCSSKELPQSSEQVNEPQVTQKSPPKRKSNSWSTAVAGKADRIDTFAAPPAEEPIRAPSKSPRKSKVLSSDESEDEDYKANSLIDDEAIEVGSDEESMTKSERDEMELNEIVEEGESLGSRDTNADEIDSADDEESDANDSFVDDDEVENQYEMSASEEEIEKEELTRPKRKSRIIRESSSDEEQEQAENLQPLDIDQEATSDIEQSSAKENSVSPQNTSEKEKSASPQKVANSPFKVLANIEVSNRVSSRRSLPTHAAEGASKKSRNSIPSSWRVDNIEDENNPSTPEPALNERKRKRESVIHGAKAKRFREMSPNESEAVHMENADENQDIVEEPLPSAKKTKKSKQTPVVDISKLLDRCEEHLEKFDSEKKAKLALKRKKIEEKKLKKAQGGDVEGSPGSENKENSAEKKKKKKVKAKKQPLLSEIEPQKEDMATKLNKRQEKLEQKREKKRKKKEITKTAKGTDEEPMEMEEPAPITKKKKTLDASESKQKKRKVVAEELPVEVVSEKKSSKKRRIEETIVSNDDDDFVVERPMAKKTLKILQVMQDPSQKSRFKDAYKEKETEDFVVPTPTVTSKLKTLIPKGLDDQQTKKTLKKKGQGKVVAEPRMSLPRPVWTSAGTFIEEPVKPYKFKSTEYKPINAAGSSTQFRVIPFEAKSRKVAPKNSKMELLMQRNKGRDKGMRNMKNLM